jgi:nicotinamide mononucleotide transporter
LINIFDINCIFVTVSGYRLSYLELIGTVSGMLCVFLTAKEKIICWPIGIINIVFFFIMFYEVQLYSDMILQIFFLVTTVFGWWKWLHPKDKSESNKKNELKITNLSIKLFLILTFISAAGVAVLGTFMSKIHILLPALFKKAASYPYPDAFTTVFSITAQILMTYKKKDCWILWIIVDAVSTVLYLVKGINLVSIEYFIFTLIAVMGYVDWTREQKTYTASVEENV